MSFYSTFAHWRLAVLYAYSGRRAVDPYYADPGLAGGPLWRPLAGSQYSR